MRYLVIFILVSIAQTSLSQSSKPDSVGKEVFVENWMEIGYFLPPGFWDENKSKEIIDQIGKVEFENVKKYSDARNIPCPFLIICNGKKKKLPELREKLEQLHAFEIANFHQYNSSGDFKGIYSILMVPYKGNENWDSSAKWDKVYFIVSKDLISEKKAKVYLNKEVRIQNWREVDPLCDTCSLAALFSCL
jgi:hypothetical protein